jgi:hypothetical protein
MKVALTVFCMSLGMLAVLDAIFSWRIVRRIWVGFQPDNRNGGEFERIGQGVVGLILVALGVLLLVGVKMP